MNPHDVAAELRARSARVRRSVGRRLWDFAGWVHGENAYEPDDANARYWEIRFLIHATEKVADEAFERCSDAMCGVDHHHLDPCPGPSFMGSMEPGAATSNPTSNPVRASLRPVTTEETDE